jgi:hypothetical protein
MLLKAVLLIAVLNCVRAEIDHSLCKLDLVFCLDNSGSIAIMPDLETPDKARPPRNWKLIQDFAQDLTRELTISPTASQVGLVDFGSKATIRFGLNEHQTKDDVLNAIGQVPFIGARTNTTGGLFKSRTVQTDPQYGGRPGVPKVVVLVTDGEPDIEVENTLIEAQNLKKAGVRVLIVGITYANYAEDLLKEMAFEPSDYLYVENFDDLESIKSRVLDDEACKPLPTTTPPPTTAPPTTKPPTTAPPTTKPPTTQPPTTIQPTVPAALPDPIEEPIIYC